MTRIIELTYNQERAIFRALDLVEAEIERQENTIIIDVLARDGDYQALKSTCHHLREVTQKLILARNN